MEDKKPSTFSRTFLVSSDDRGSSAYRICLIISKKHISPALQEATWKCCWCQDMIFFKVLFLYMSIWIVQTLDVFPHKKKRNSCCSTGKLQMSWVELSADPFLTQKHTCWRDPPPKWDRIVSCLYFLSDLAIEQNSPKKKYVFESSEIMEDILNSNMVQTKIEQIRNLMECCGCSLSWKFSMIELNRGWAKTKAAYGGVECHVGTGDGSVSGVKTTTPC